MPAEGESDLLERELGRHPPEKQEVPPRERGSLPIRQKVDVKFPSLEQGQ
jgi:hypothetical protein